MRYVPGPGLDVYAQCLVVIQTQRLWVYRPKDCGAMRWSSSLVLVISGSVVSNSLRPHGLQHARLPCPLPSPGACSNSCPSSQWCHPTILSSVISFSSRLQSFPALGSFPMSQFFASGGQSIRVLASASVKCQQIWKTQQWPQDWKRSVFIPIPKKGNAKEGSNYHTIALISHVSKIMLKIIQARLQQYVNHEFPDVQAEFRKGRGTRDQIANICWIIERAREFQKNIYFCFIDYAKPLTVWITINCGKFWKRWNYQTTWPASWEICMQVRKQQLELDME